MNRRVYGRVLAVLLLCLCSIGAHAQSTYTQTRYPIVLVHGLLGFDSVLGVYDYWYAIGNELKADGAQVYAASFSASNYTEVRGEQLIHDLDTLRAVTGKQKFNLIGHSHGGPTARYVVSVHPDLVASVTLLGFPNASAPMADAISTTLPPASPLRDRGLVRQCLQRFSGRLVGQQRSAECARRPRIPECRRFRTVQRTSSAGQTGDDLRQRCGDGQWHPLLLAQR